MSTQPNPLAVSITSSQHVYEVGPRKDHRGFASFNAYEEPMSSKGIGLRSNVQLLEALLNSL